MAGLTATAEVDIAAPAAAVWQALTDPERIKKYFLGATVHTDWQPGSTITWSGEYEGHPFLDHGTVIKVQPEELLIVTHFSPSSGQPDVPESYHTLTYRLTREAPGTHLSLTQDNNSSAEAVEHSRNTWQSMLEALKGQVEREGMV